MIFVILPFFTNAQACPSNSTFSSNQATLVGQITDTGGDSNISAWFEWGRSSSLGYTTPVQNLRISYVPYQYCYTITNLSPCTTYYYRAVVQNSAGVNYGETRSFTTRCTSESSQLTASCYAYPNPAYVGDIVTFYSNVSGGSGNYSYSWSGDCISNSSICTKAFPNPGSYYAYLIAYSGSQSVNTSCSVNILARQMTQTSGQTSIQNQRPIAEIQYSPSAITPGTMVTFSSLSSYDPDGKIILYEWRVNDRIVSNQPTFSRTLSSGTYKITLTVVDDRGATSSKELVISVGRTQYVPQTVVRTVTRTIRVPVQNSAKSTSLPSNQVNSNQGNFIDISIDENITTSICKKDSLNITVLNNSSQGRSITFTVNGEIKKWFKPKARIIQVSANDVNSFKWAYEIPCDAEEGEYYGIITASINGVKKDFPVNISVVKSRNVFEPITAFAGGLFDPRVLPWLLVIILILINFAMWYFLVLKSRSKIE